VIAHTTAEEPRAVLLSGHTPTVGRQPSCSHLLGPGRVHTCGRGLVPIIMAAASRPRESNQVMRPPPKTEYPPPTWGG